jgi:Cu(I)/Ag(I) efflux system membrane fusion protein
VIRTGERTLVMITQGSGGYRPVEVRIGREAGGRTEVLAGLAAGEEVVTSGQFLLDSEASLAGIDVRSVDDAPTTAGETEAQTEAEEPSTYRATGTIERITARSITLRHGPVEALEWPAMTMGFAIEGPAQVRGFQRGDRVTFTFVQASTGPRIVSIRKTGQ